MEKDTGKSRGQSLHGKSRPSNPLLSRRAKLSFSVVLFLLLCLCSSWYALFLIKVQCENDVRLHLEKVVEITHSAIHRWVDHRSSDAALLADRPDMRQLIQELLGLPSTKEALLGSDALQRLRNLVRPGVEEYQDLDVVIISPDGITIASLHDAIVGNEIFRAAQAQQLNALFQGEAQLVLPLNYEPDKPGHRTGEVQRILITVPVYDAGGKVIAGLGLQIDPAHDFSRIIQIARSGKSGDAYAMDQHGLLLSGIRFGDQLQELGLLGQGEKASLNFSLRDPGGNMLEGFRPALARHKLPHTLAAEQLMAGKNGSNVTGYRDYRGVMVVGAWAWYAHNNFGLIYEHDVVDAYASYIFFRRTVLAALLFISLLFLSLLVILSRHQRETVMLNRKLAAKIKAQQKSEQKYTRLVDNLKEKYFFYSYDGDGVIRFISPGVTRILGYSPQDLAENLQNYLTDNPINQEVELTTRRTLQGKQIKPYRVEVYHQDGSLRQLEMIKTPVWGEDGSVIGVEGMGNDITEQLAREETLRISKFHLLEAQRIGHIGSWEWDITTGRLTWSDEIYHIFGRSRLDFSPDFNKFLSWIHPDDRKGVQDQVNKALANETPYGISHRIILPDNSERVVYEQGKVLFDKSGQAREMHGTVQDITEQRAVEQELEQYRQGLEDLVAKRTASLNEEIDARKKVGALLSTRLKEVERFSRLATGREKRMVELKKEINALLAAQGQERRYTIVS